MELDDELSKELITLDQHAIPATSTAKSFEGNKTGETFEGVRIAGAIEADQQVIQIDCEDLNSDEKQHSKKVKPPRASKNKMSKAVKKFEVGKRQKDLVDAMLDEPIEEIKLTHDEAVVLKNVLLRNYLAELDSTYKKVANKEVNYVRKAV